jgi:hypothetical protein
MSELKDSLIISIAATLADLFVYCYLSFPSAFMRGWQWLLERNRDPYTYRSHTLQFLQIDILDDKCEVTDSAIS